jgi:hypothetical protein
VFLSVSTSAQQGFDKLSLTRTVFVAIQQGAVIKQAGYLIKQIGSSFLLAMTKFFDCHTELVEVLFTISTSAPQGFDKLSLTTISLA